MKTKAAPPLLLVLILFLAGAPPALATSFVMVADRDLVLESPLVVEATVLAVDPAPTERPSTDYLLQIDDVLKGEAPASTIVLRVIGGQRPDGSLLIIWGAPRFRVGEPTLLFLAPNADGTFRSRHFMLGAFHLVDTDSRRVALRNLADATQHHRDGARTEGPRDEGRDFDRFSRWIEAVARGEEPAADYRVDLGPLEAARLDDRFTLIRIAGRKVRWFEFDRGETVQWQAHRSGQDGLAGGGFNEFRRGLGAWNSESQTPLDLVYTGTTTATAGFIRTDGNNVLLFNDPQGEMDPFSCTSGGALAVGGPWANPIQTGSWNGETYLRILEADIITNRNIGCFFDGSPDPAKVAEEIFAHETGHGLGLAHSCGDTPSGACNTTRKREALMRATVHDDRRGARLEADDLAGIRFLYKPSSTAPQAPADVLADHLNGSTVEITWTDRSANEAGFRIYRDDAVLETEMLIGEAGPNSTTFIDETVTAGVTYAYRVAAHNASGERSSESVSVTPSDFVTSPALPGFRVRVELSTSQVTTIGRKETACIPETICFSGAIPGRSETFIRIVGPKPNGYLWPTLVKFSTATADIVIEQISTGATQRYVLAGATPGNDDLPGLFDRTGFLPDASEAPLIRSIDFWPFGGERERRSREADDPPPPDIAPFLSSEFPDFRFWVRITNQQGTEIPTSKEGGCIPETLCVSGAVAGRSEVFVRIVGPKPNGFLWPTLVKFSTSQVEIWIQQISTGVTRYYLFEGASPGSSDLTGRFDRLGFVP